jgi:hypothetical protein
MEQTSKAKFNKENNHILEFRIFRKKINDRRRKAKQAKLARRRNRYV